MNEVKMKKRALIGFVGGLLFAIGDILVYLLPNCHNQELIFSDWLKMSGLRPAICMCLGCIGGVFLLVGFSSWYTALKQSGLGKYKYLMMLILFGIVITPIGHFVIACMGPMAYKGAVLAGASHEMAVKIMANWTTYTDIIKIAVMSIIILVQSVVMIIFIIKRKINCPKWMVILNPLIFTILSAPVSILLDGTGIEGIAESFESLGEGLMYIAVYYHWKNNNA